MSTTLESRIAELTRANEARQQGAGERYHQLVVDSTDGVEMDVEECAQVLADAGKSPADLEADCSLLEKRRAWAAVIADAEGHNQRAGELEVQIARLTSERQRAWEEITKQLNDLHVARDGELHYVSGVSPSKTHLLTTAWPAVKERVQTIRAELAQRGPMLVELEEHLTTLRSSLINDERLLAQVGARALIGSDRQFVDSHRMGLVEQIADGEKRLADLKATQNEILERLAEAESELLKP